MIVPSGPRKSADAVEAARGGRGLPTVTFAADCELWIDRLPVFCPTRPPAMMPVNEPPLTEPLRTLTFVTVPSFWPASGPINWLFAFAVCRRW